MSGPLAPFARDFAASLVQRGFASYTVARHVGLLAALSAWMERERLEVASLTPEVLSRFVKAHPPGGKDAGPRRLLAFLRAVSAVQSPPTVATSAVDVLLDRYRWYLRTERRLEEVTIDGYLHRVRPFLERRVVAGELVLEELTAPELEAFAHQECLQRSRESAKLTVTALRSLLRFLHIEGLLDVPLAHAVPTVASWRLAKLPRPLRPGAMARLLESCDRTTTLGRRDFAILSLLARLGLRRGEVVKLALDDIDWRAGELIVRGKGGREDRMPLPADVGEALADYIVNGRPSVAARRVFLRVLAPIEPLCNGGVGGVVRRAAEQAEVRGASTHRLRHTVATDTLREGASLAEVGELLRHAHAATTAIYAKVDRERLRPLAQPWPGGAA